MYVQMRLRRYHCADCGTLCKSTSTERRALPRLRKAATQSAEP